MRSRVEPGGWQANSVAGGRVVWSTIHMRVGLDDLGAESTWYT